MQRYRQYVLPKCREKPDLQEFLIPENEEMFHSASTPLKSSPGSESDARDEKEPPASNEPSRHTATDTSRKKKPTFFQTITSPMHSFKKAVSSSKLGKIDSSKNDSKENPPVFDTVEPLINLNEAIVDTISSDNSEYQSIINPDRSQHDISEHGVIPLRRSDIQSLQQEARDIESDVKRLSVQEQEHPDTGVTTRVLAPIDPEPSPVGTGEPDKKRTRPSNTPQGGTVPDTVTNVVPDTTKPGKSVTDTDTTETSGIAQLRTTVVDTTSTNTTTNAVVPTESSTPERKSYAQAAIKASPANSNSSASTSSSRRSRKKKNKKKNKGTGGVNAPSNLKDPQDFS